MSMTGKIDRVEVITSVQRRRRWSAEEKAQIVQETYARVLARPRVIREDERAYLMRAMRNTFYSRLRTASRRPQQTATLEDVEPVDPRSGNRPDRAAEFGEIAVGSQPYRVADEP